MIASLLITIALLSIAYLPSPATGFAMMGMRRPSVFLSGRAKVMCPPTVANGPESTTCLRMLSGIPQGVDFTMEVVSRRDLQKRTQQAEEEKRIKEEAERIRNEPSALRVIEEDALNDLYECVKNCKESAADAWDFETCRFEIRNLTDENPDHNLRDSQLVRLREVLDRELPLRFPGVDFELKPMSSGFEVDLDWSLQDEEDEDDAEDEADEEDKEDEEDEEYDEEVDEEEEVV